VYLCNSFISGAKAVTGFLRYFAAHGQLRTNSYFLAPGEVTRGQHEMFHAINGVGLFYPQTSWKYTYHKWRGFFLSAQIAVDPLRCLFAAVG